MYLTIYLIKDIVKTNNKIKHIHILPLQIKDGNYLLYKTIHLRHRQTYTIKLRGSTYFDGRGYGIRMTPRSRYCSNEGTPVYAVQVVLLYLPEKKGGRGKTITIEHLQNGNKI